MDPTPFVSETADVVLRTSDGLSLKVHSRILIVASTFFRSLFTLPQPASDGPSSPTAVDMPEKSEVVYMLMTLIYPIEDPQIHSLPLLVDILKTAMKYEMAYPIQTLRRLLVSSPFTKEPLRLIAIACQYNFVEEAKMASTMMLNVDILDGPPVAELKDITAYDYHRLLSLHRTRAFEAQKLLVYNGTVRCQGCSLRTINFPYWWNDFVTRAKAELARAPTTNVIFSMKFLSQAAAGSGCQRCGEHIIHSHQFLENLKNSIDALPSTI